MSGAEGVHSNPITDAPKAPLVLLQSLRAIAASMVVYFHFYLWSGKYFSGSAWLPSFSAAGESGVDIFFVISGFIMSHITPREHRSWRDQLVFIYRRFGRIYPTYWAVALVLLVIWLRRPDLFNSYAGNKVDVVASLLLIPSHVPGVIFVAWTLVCELFYYLICSFLFYFSGLPRLVLLLLWLLVPLVVHLMHLSILANPWVSVAAHPLTIEFVAGMLLAEAFRRGVGWISPRFAIIAVVLSVVLMLAWGALHGGYFTSHEQLSRALFYGGPALILVWMCLQMNLQGVWLFLGRLSPLGDRSYSLYLVHLPVVALVYRCVASVMPRGSGVVALPCVAVLIVIALIFVVEVLYRFVELPMHELARKSSRRLAGYLASRAPAPSEPT